MSIKTIIGNVFISPLTDIIYEYVKCYYCSNIKSGIASYLEKNSEIKYRRPFEVHMDVSDNVIDGIIISKLNDKIHLYIFYYEKKKEWHNSTGLNTICTSLSIDALVYFIAHLNISRFYDTYNIDHTDMPINKNFDILMMLLSIGIKN